MRILLDESLPIELRSELPYQQNLDALPIAVVVLVAQSNRIEQLRPLLSRLLEVLSSLQPRTLVRLEA